MASIDAACRRALFIEEISFVQAFPSATFSAAAGWRLLNSKYVIPAMIVIAVVVGEAFMFYIALFGLQPD